MEGLREQCSVLRNDRNELVQENVRLQGTLTHVKALVLEFVQSGLTRH